MHAHTCGPWHVSLRDAPCCRTKSGRAAAPGPRLPAPARKWRAPAFRELRGAISVDEQKASRGHSRGLTSAHDFSIVSKPSRDDNGAVRVLGDRCPDGTQPSDKNRCTAGDTPTVERRPSAPRRRCAGAAAPPARAGCWTGTRCPRARSSRAPGPGRRRRPCAAWRRRAAGSSPPAPSWERF